MNVLVILAHPDSGSFNHAITETVIGTLQRNHHQVVFHDLYDENFDPLLPRSEILRDSAVDPVIEEHCSEIAQAEGIIIVHPNWWSQPPAILKGWVDRVIRPGVAYQFLEKGNGEGVPVGLLKAKKVLIFNTSNTPPQMEAMAAGDLLEALWRGCIFQLCGVEEFYRKNYASIVISSLEDRMLWLEDVRSTVDLHFPG